MQDYITERVLEVSHYILEEEATVRQAAFVFGASKSTIHKDLTERLPMINKPMHLRVKNVLAKNKAERHIRGGEATRKKYMEESR